jgi:hypothetical protein
VADALSVAARELGQARTDGGSQLPTKELIMKELGERCFIAPRSRRSRAFDEPVKALKLYYWKQAVNL